MLALGVIVTSGRGTTDDDLMALLFGDVSRVDDADLALQAAVAVLTVLAVVVPYRPFLALSFHRDTAAALGLRPGLAHVAMLVLLALAVVASFRVAGTLLVFGLLVVAVAQFFVVLLGRELVEALRRRPAAAAA